MVYITNGEEGMDFKLLNIRIMFKDETDAERFRDKIFELIKYYDVEWICLLYTSPSPRDRG